MSNSAEITRDTTVATTILEQLGGRRFVAMTGARNLRSGGSALVFRLPARFAKDGINAVKITLAASDTYSVEFKKVARNGFKVAVVASFENVYADQLQSIFQTATGLSTRLF